MSWNETSNLGLNELHLASSYASYYTNYECIPENKTEISRKKQCFGRQYRIGLDHVPFGSSMITSTKLKKGLTISVTKLQSLLNKSDSVDVNLQYSDGPV